MQTSQLQDCTQHLCREADLNLHAQAGGHQLLLFFSGLTRLLQVLPVQGQRHLHFTGMLCRYHLSEIMSGYELGLFVIPHLMRNPEPIDTESFRDWIPAFAGMTLFYKFISLYKDFK
jgi:hypothetical protein